MEFIDTDLRGARFVRADLTGVVMRAVELAGADLDAPWIAEDDRGLRVNGVDVVPLVEAELDRRFPGRALRKASDLPGLRTAWAAVEATWEATLARVAAMPAGSVEVSVAGEWSFAQTLRHLVMATDVWLRGAVLGIEQPYHPLGQPHAEYASDGYDLSVFSTEHPTYEQVLAARADRVVQVREFLAGDADLEREVQHPWAPDRSVTVLKCVHVIVQEEWDHHRFAVRDLEVISAQK